jgi:aryl-alcohol dehydrogenase-like predicted oxidoreductase
MMTYGDPKWREWTLGEEAAEPFVRRAADAGINFFDTADVYSTGVSEEVTGRLLARVFPSRDDYVLATKVHGAMGPGPNDRGLSRKHILSSIENSLRRLGTDYVDIYQIHRWDRIPRRGDHAGALTTWSVPARPVISTPRPCTPPGFAKAQHIGCDTVCRCRTTTTWSTTKRNGR